MYSVTTLIFDPIIPVLALFVLGGLMLAACALIFASGQRRIWLRLIAVLALIVTLLNPVSVTENRQKNANLVLVIADQSDSQSISNRETQAQDALRFLNEELDSMDDMQLSISMYRHEGLADLMGGEDALQSGQAFAETRLYRHIKSSLQSVDQSRLAAVILISDGQVHDIPEALIETGRLREDLGLQNDIPMHLLLTGEPEEMDRQIIIERAALYGLVGEDVDITIRLRVSGNARAQRLPLTVRVNGSETQTTMLSSDEQHTISVPVTLSGHNVVELSIPYDEAELTAKNNQSVLTINGVRDRLQVMLVSGKPHHGGRMWRDILASDAGVDLVHFTILREPGKFDNTPDEELSLIEFPIRELFETKIKNFDLIILDNYGLTYLLPLRYFDNMHDFVAEGGGLLIAAGPEAVEDFSIFETPLEPLIPARSGNILHEGPFVPSLSPAGRRHPITSFMQPLMSHQGQAAQRLSPWFRHIQTQAKPEAQTLLYGSDLAPLLMVQRYQEGRSALLTSDQLWLWARGYMQGGPERALIKRLLHWLMKEPDLEEEGLQVTVEGRTIFVEKRTMDQESQSLTMQRPNGMQETLLITPQEGQSSMLSINADAPGIYRFFDGKHTAFAVVGELNTPEQLDLIATEEKLKPMIASLNGGIAGLHMTAEPDLRSITNSSNRDRFRTNHPDEGFSSWLGLFDRQSFTVMGQTQTPLIPTWLGFLIAFLLLAGSWLYEGRVFSKRKSN